MTETEVGVLARGVIDASVIHETRNNLTSASPQFQVPRPHPLTSNRDRLALASPFPLPLLKATLPNVIPAWTPA